MKRTVSEMTRGKALAAGEIGRQWLEALDSIVDALEARWKIRVGEGMNGGSHAFAAPAEGEGREQYVLKVEIPDVPEEEFLHGIRALQMADGRGYAKLIAFDAELRACLLERLGAPLRQCGIPPRRQMEIICDALMQTWSMPAAPDGLALGVYSDDLHEPAPAFDRSEAAGRTDARHCAAVARITLAKRKNAVYN